MSRITNTFVATVALAFATTAAFAQVQVAALAQLIPSPLNGLGATPTTINSAVNVGSDIFLTVGLSSGGMGNSQPGIVRASNVGIGLTPVPSTWVDTATLATARSPVTTLLTGVLTNAGTDGLQLLDQGSGAHRVLRISSSTSNTVSPYNTNSNMTVGMSSPGFATFSSSALLPGNDTVGWDSRTLANGGNRFIRSNGLNVNATLLLDPVLFSLTDDLTAMNFGGVTADPSGKIYFANNNTTGLNQGIWSFDGTTLTKLVSLSSLVNLTALFYAPDNLIYYRTGSTTGVLSSLDPTNGNTTVVLPSITQVSNFLWINGGLGWSTGSGSAGTLGLYVIPEPATLAAFGLGASVLLTRRRK